MTFPEVVSLILMAIVALQMWFIRYLIRTSLETMRGSHEVSQMAMDLSHRVLASAKSPAYRGDQAT